MIRKLPIELSNKIAAGEVVERPSSVVKELVENSIDAGATEITISIENAGKSLIKISDNGFGIAKSDLPLLFERHATSKISKNEDIFAIKSLGFRGEALASIAAVSRIEMTSKTHDSKEAYQLMAHGGIVSQPEVCGREMGTTFSVRDLFYNTPARYKFLKSDRREEAEIIDLVAKLALSRPDIRFKLLINKKEKIHTDGKNILSNVIFNIYGREIVDHLWPINIQDEKNNIKIQGYITDTEYTRGNRLYQNIFVNKRYVHAKDVQKAVNTAYDGHLMIGRFPAFVLMLTLNESKVDVNIHPAKTEVKLEDSDIINELLTAEIAKSFDDYSQLPLAYLTEEKEEETTTAELTDSKVDSYLQRYAKKRQHDIYIPQNFTENKASSVAEDFKSLEAKTEQLSEDYFANSEEITRISEELFADDEAEYFGEQMTISPKESKQSTLYDDLTIIGVLFSTFIICQKGKSAYLIDQHAAHERVLYEKYKRYFETDNVASQSLLQAFIYHCDAKTYTKIEQHLTTIKQMGIDLEPFGNNEWLIRAVPLIGNTPFSEVTVREILDSFEKFDDQTLAKVEAEHVIRRSCRTAVKARDYLTDDEIYALLDLLKEYDNPYTCPHGRPIIIELTEYELEKKFKRIV